MSARSNAAGPPSKRPRQSPRARTRAPATAQHSRASTRSTSKKAASTRTNDHPASGDSEPVAGFGEPRWPGDSRPPFAPGNQLAVGNTSTLVHGATSPRAIAERAELVHGQLLQHAPYLAEPKFLPAADRYLKAAAREALLHAHIERVSADKGPGAVPARVWEQATAAARLAAKLGSDLGLDPIGHARIRALSAGADVSEASLADMAAEGKAIRERAQARQDAALAPVIELGGTEGQEGDEGA